MCDGGARRSALGVDARRGEKDLAVKLAPARARRPRLYSQAKMTQLPAGPSLRRVTNPAAAALLAGIGLAALAAGLWLGARDDSRHAGGTVVVDESSGRVGRVALGETRENVIGALGRSLDRGPGFAPAGELPSDAGVAPQIGLPRTQRRQPELLRYTHLAVMLVRNRVFAILVDDPGATTRRAVQVGDPLSAVRASYGNDASCYPTPSGGELETYPYCRVVVPAGRMVLGGDPIRGITMVAPAS